MATSGPRAGARAVALEALLEVDNGAYANLIVPRLLDRSELDGRDRAFVTELAYGTTRMRRACDWLVDRFVTRPLDAETRNALRLGAYQLAFAGVAPHAAVAATVDAAPKRSAGLVNAVLRKVADRLPVSVWPDLATELSYPDWIVDRLVRDLGPDDAVATLRRMNEPPTVTERADGYVQDEASQRVAAAVEVEAGSLVADVCAAPGGKATAMAAAAPDAFVVAADLNPTRIGLIAGNVARLRAKNVVPLVADARTPPFPPAAFDRVLVDAPCSGLGVLRRRPDARWRIGQDDVTRLAELQKALLDAAVGLCKPGGMVVYSVCTLTLAETAGIDKWLADTYPYIQPVSVLGPPWERLGRGARLLPHKTDTDGMYVLRLRRRPV